uniref:Putative mating pair formation protein n=1 Tax=Stenotrophomonas maltophilia TaxID=40324 RepID=Q7WZL9_STEMA|nr:putative mating pair formation protein [Stenotrophomonas maltophilia]
MSTNIRTTWNATIAAAQRFARTGVMCVALTAAGAACIAVGPANAQWAVTDLPQTIQVMLADLKRAQDDSKSFQAQSQQLSTQLRQYEDMARNSGRLSESQWASVTGDMKKLRNVYNKTKALAYQAQDFDKQFKGTFRDYKAFASARRDKNFEDEYAKWAESGFDNAKNAMEAGGMQVEMMDDEDAVLADLVAQSQSAGGRMQALQVGNQMAAQQVQQTQKLRQLLAAQTNMQAQALAQQTQRQAAEDANTNRFFNQPKKSKGKEF